MNPLPEIDPLWEFSDPAASEQRFRALLPGPRSRAWRAEVLSQIARALGLQRRFDEAYATLDRAEALLSEHKPSAQARVRCLLERGRVLNTSGDPASSRALFRSAWELAREQKLDFYAVDAAHMLGIVEAPERQLEWIGRAIQAAQASADPRARAWMGSLLNNLGWSKMSLGRYEEALEHFQRAFIFRQEQGKPAEIRIARWCAARALRALGRLDEALTIQRALHAEWQSAGEPDGYVCEELGELNLELGRADEARPFFGEAFHILSQDPTLTEHEPQRLVRLKSLS